MVWLVSFVWVTIHLIKISLTEYFYYNIPLPYNNSYLTSIIANLNAQSMSEALLQRKGAEREMSNPTFSRTCNHFGSDWSMRTIRAS